VLHLLFEVVNAVTSSTLNRYSWSIDFKFDWFFESMVERILNSSCRLKMVIDFEFYSSGYTSYP
jgi:hypothetical protein